MIGLVVQLDQPLHAALQAAPQPQATAQCRGARRRAGPRPLGWTVWMANRIELRARAAHRFVYAGATLFVTNRYGMVAGEGAEGFSIENTRLLCREESKVERK